MDGFSGEGTALNSFALVAYLPDPLVGFVDRLRQEIESGCHLRAHLTLLPPRPVSVAFDQMEKQLADALRISQPFRVQLGEIQVFPVTRVIHLSVEAGFSEATHIHEALNCGGLRFAERYQYHPHVTLGQHLTPEELDPAMELARERWSKYGSERFFVADHLTLVQNIGVDRWKNLQDFPLGAPVPVLS
jgi:2'-5' RNA ligase